MPRRTSLHRKQLFARLELFFSSKVFLGSTYQFVRYTELFLIETADKLVVLLEWGGCITPHGSRNDEWGPGFIDEDRVDLIDDRIRMLSLYTLF